MTSFMFLASALFLKGSADGGTSAAAARRGQQQQHDKVLAIPSSKGYRQAVMERLGRHYYLLVSEENKRRTRGALKASVNKTGQPSKQGTEFLRSSRAVALPSFVTGLLPTP